MRTRIYTGIYLLAFVLALLVSITVYVQTESDYTTQVYADDRLKRALVLYHPSRDARFSNELSLAFTSGLLTAGFTVERATISSDTPDTITGYDIVGIVSNTYFFRPDIPTEHYLSRVDFNGVKAVGLMAGAGSTAGAARLLRKWLRRSNADLLDVSEFWILRPNNETPTNKSNWEVAMDKAYTLGVQTAASIL